MTPEKFYGALGAWFPRRVRSWLYVTAVAVLGAAAVLYGVDGDTVEAIGAVVFAALFGVAKANVPKSE